ncbi:MAG: transglutaminase domain-containing protein [Dehalococcoidia bacterium]
MVRLCTATAQYLYRDFTPLRVLYQWGAAPELEQRLEMILKGGSDPEEAVVQIVAFCRGVAEAAADDDLDTMVVGGTEEQIIERGSDWCTDLARVACVLCQVAGIPARLVYLADTRRAYSAHAIIEAYRDGTWGAIDPTTGVIYQHLDGRPTLAWDLQRDRGPLASHWPDTTNRSERVGQFRRATLANYFVWERQHYDCTVSPINSYYRTILDMAAQGWPGGLRWLHDEDEHARRRHA